MREAPGERERPAAAMAGSLLGRDEMNFAEFPLALLTDRAPKDQKTIEAQDRIYDDYPDVVLEMISSRTFDGRIQLLEYVPTILSGPPGTTQSTPSSTRL